MLNRQMRRFQQLTEMNGKMQNLPKILPAMFSTSNPTYNKENLKKTLVYNNYNRE